MAVRRVEHVDLESNLEARIQYLHAFLDFSDHDIQTLIGGAKYVHTLIPGIADKFYKKLLQHETTAKALNSLSNDRTEPIEEAITYSSPQLQYRKLLLEGYLQKLFSDPRKIEYWQYLDQIGSRHAHRGPGSLHVPLVHLGAALGYLHGSLNEAILRHPRLKTERKTDLIVAVGKIMWIQNDLFSRWQNSHEVDRSRGLPG